MGKYVKDQKVVAYTLLGLEPCTVVRVGWIFITVREEETGHLYSVRKSKMTPIEEEEYYLVEESIDDEGLFGIGRLFAKIEAEDMGAKNHLKKMKTSRNTKIFTIHQKETVWWRVLYYNQNR